MKEARFDRACPALAESFRLEPLPGTLFTLAECEARWGRVASAVAHYEDYLEVFSGLSVSEQSGQRTRPQIAAAKRADLSPRVPHLTLRLTRPQPADAVVYRDDTRLGAPALGVRLPIDPGSHTIRVEIAGRPVSSVSVTLTEGQNLELPVDPTPPTTPTLPTLPTSPVPASAPRARWNRPLLWTGGALLVGAGASYGVAWSKSRTIEEAASSGKPYPESAGNYRTWEWTAVGFAAAGLGLLGAAAWLALPSHSSITGNAERQPLGLIYVAPLVTGWTAGAGFAF